ncbi:28 kDa ribonucleoprotein, chloroplastic-like isoform X1 [Triticum urartu]|uniref:28 kDa ribonucleoprotein, chloroplastic-like isoform X1 n=1 Tax=Triticum urartu TaxID=4572 RepID=UPI00204451FD|nr:28 kDa ribonucleoprotein, chloroplastic-like isoform X1 [Triticum urartu]
MLQHEVKQETRDPWDEAKVYVRNLPYDVSSERLVQLFGQDVVVEVTVSICGIGDRRCITRLGIFLRTSRMNPRPLL